MHGILARNELVLRLVDLAINLDPEMLDESLAAAAVNAGSAHVINR